MSIQFRKRKISDTPYEACSVFDVDRDGIPDIVSGEYWFAGPEFRLRHKICTIEAYNQYHKDFCDYPLDVDGDGWLDIITASYWDKAIYWRQNPREAGKEWPTYEVGPAANIETVRCFDIDGCGTPEIFPNETGSPQCFFKLVRDERGQTTAKFEKVVIGTEKSGHGMGFADINGDGRIDIVLRGGWLEQPEDPYQTPWTFHPEFELGRASVPVLGYDVNGDGLCDLIVGSAHDYGLFWYEQRLDGEGRRNWIRHEIDMSASQFHDLQLVDLDQDGQPELVTGKRYRAHNDNDAGAHDPVGLYYYKINGGAFEKHVIDYGPAGEASGCGIYFWVHDLSGNGYPDIIAPGKEGLFLFENVGPAALGENRR